ncbi:MAG TPA: hypothetical protein VKZ56_04620 [Membranihabitans sp.]|nr:hypothetical protein [Membranihabitans sp.]
MKKPVIQWAICIMIAAGSCVNEASDQASESKDKSSTGVGSIEVVGIEIPDLDTVELIQHLQGIWRDPEYPFNRVEFQASTLKMVEEGVAEPARFQPFALGHRCPHHVTNMDKAQPNDTILIWEESDRCEKLTIRADTLVLSGYNPHSETIYSMDYVRVQ